MEKGLLSCTRFDRAGEVEEMPLTFGHDDSLALRLSVQRSTGVSNSFKN